VAVPGGRQTTTVFGLICQNAAPGTLSTIALFLYVFTRGNCKTAPGHKCILALQLLAK